MDRLKKIDIIKYLLVVGLVILTTQAFGQKKTVVCLGSAFFGDTVVIRHHKTTLLDTIITIGINSHELIPIAFERKKSDKSLAIYINNDIVFLSLDRVKRNTLIIIHHYDDPEMPGKSVHFKLFNLRRFKKNNKKLFEH